MMTPEEYEVAKKRMAAVNRSITRLMRSPADNAKPRDPVAHEAELRGAVNELDTLYAKILDYEIAKRVQDMTPEQRKARLYEIADSVRGSMNEVDSLEFAKLLFGPDGSFAR